MSKIINVGRVTAYAEAVAGGYTGTREEWERDLAALGTTAAEVEANRQAVAEDKAAVEENLTTVESYKKSAAQSASEAAHSAANAHTDALAATAEKEAAQTAQGLADEAKEAAAESKTAAENAQTEADQSARAAAESALAAGNAAQTATNQAGAASESAAAAAASAAAAAEAARTLTIDTTLTESGRAADAKAAGDAVKTVKATIDNIMYGIDFSALTWQKGGFDGSGNTTYRNLCRCRMTAYASYPVDITIKPLTNRTGFGFAEYVDGTPMVIWTSPKSETINIPKNTLFRIFIDGRLGLTAVEMSIEELLSTVSFASDIAPISDTTKRVDELYADSAPEYFFEDDYLPGKTLTAAKNASYNGAKFGFISDVHMGDTQSASMAAAKYIKAHSTALPFMIYGGDTITTQVGTEDGMYEQIGAWQKQMSIFGASEVYQCRGNHDYTASASGTTINASIGLCVSGVVGNRPYDVHLAYKDAMSYYFDLPETRTRIVVIDDYANQGQGNFSGYVALTQELADWILADALNVNGYNIIVVSHQPLNLYGDSEAYGLTGSLKPLRDTLTALKYHTSVNSSYGQVTFVHDFSASTAKLICVLSGHKHTDYFGGVGGIMTIGITADCTKYGAGHIAETVTAGSFDCIAFDYNAAAAYLTRIGAGADRIAHYDAIDVTATATLTSALTGTLTWAADDTAVATVADGVVTAVSSGSCIVTAADENGKVEAWLVRVVA